MDVRVLASPFTAAALACLALASLASIARAQIVEEELVPLTSPCSRTSRLGSEMDCDAGAADGSLVIEREVSFPMQLESQTLETGQCQAEVKLDNLQYDTYARVSGSVDTTTCAAASGSFVLVVRTGAVGNSRVTQKFPQDWEREDSQPALFSASLPIAANTDLVRVRAQRIRCTCADALPDQAD